MLRKLTRRGVAIPVGIVVVLGLVIVGYPLAGGAVAPLGGAGSPSADNVRVLYLIALALGVIIFLGVEGALIYSLVNHRFRRGAPEPEQVRGNTRLELGWTIAAAVVLVVISAITFAFLPGINNPARSEASGLRAQTRGALASVDQPPPEGGPRLTVNVIGQQYLWRYDYPGGEQVFSFHEMVVPVDTTVLLHITSTDVVHAYWVPKLFGKADAVPGHTNRAWFKATKVGSYDGNCTELCGENHAQMLNRIRVVPVAEFVRWRARQAEAIRESHALLSLSRRLGATAGEP